MLAYRGGDDDREEEQPQDEAQLPERQRQDGDPDDDERRHGGAAAVRATGGVFPPGSVVEPGYEPSSMRCDVPASRSAATFAKIVFSWAAFGWL